MGPTRYSRCLLFLSAGLACGQDNSLLSVVRGDLLEWEAGKSGELSVRAADSSVQRCRYDDKTYLERDKQRVPPASLSAGQQVEVIIDRGVSGGACYARTVRVTRDDEVRRTAAAARLQAMRVTRSPILDSIFPRGNLTFAGVVLSVGAESMLVRTRNDGQKSIHLRADTKFLNEGQASSSASLQPNMRVFIRAGKNLDDEIEAFQVVWGEILTPRP